MIAADKNSLAAQELDRIPVYAHLNAVSRFLNPFEGNPRKIRPLHDRVIVKRLEEGRVPLEESVAIYERGEALKRRCEELLAQAEARVNKIVRDSSGKATGTEPLDVG